MMRRRVAFAPEKPDRRVPFGLLIPGFLFVFVSFVLPISARAQDLVKEALATFPPRTLRLEYSQPAKLRTLHDYASLRQRYAGPNLRILEAYLAKLGVREPDIDELVLGWLGNGEELDLVGLAAGHFNPTLVASYAAGQHLAAVRVGASKAYCFGSKSPTCFVVLDKTRGAFGPAAPLAAMLQGRSGNGPSVGTDNRFEGLVKAARTDAPIWGTATGQAVTDWFKSWMPGQNEMELNWSKTFQTVEALSYSVETAEKVRLKVKLDCVSQQAAVTLRQVFEGLKLFQQLAWQNQNPNRPDPFQDLVVDNNGREVLLTLTTAYAALESAVTPRTP